MTNLEKLTEAIKSGNRNDAKAATSAELDAGTTPQTVLDAMILGMDDVGRRFRDNIIFVPEVLLSARAMKDGMALLEPKLVAAGYTPIANVVMGTVLGDLHDIGKNLVCMMLRGASFNVVDLSVNTPTQKFIDAVKQHNAQIVGMSALLTTTVPNMRDTCKVLKQTFPNLKVMVGGAPVTRQIAQDMGADGYAPDAMSAVILAKELIGIAV